MMKKRLTGALLFLMVASLTFGQYRKMDVYELALAADLIVHGTITESKGGMFTVDIEGVNAGAYNDSQITVKRFKNWKTVKRWGKYVPKEAVMLFLKLEDGNYTILGEGGEGEKLIMAGDIYLDSRGGALKNQFGYHARLLEGNIYAEKVPLEEFKDAVSGIRDCFKVQYETKVDKKTQEEFQSPYATSTCEAATLDEYRGKSWVHDKVAQQAEKAVKE